jgi:hypothetical protein
MALTNTWNVLQMDAYPQYHGETNVVFLVHWDLTATDGEYTGYVYGSTRITIEDSDVFTPYENLSKEQVIGWVKGALGEQMVTSYEKNVKKQIESARNPTVVKPALPWL